MCCSPPSHCHEYIPITETLRSVLVFISTMVMIHIFTVGLTLPKKMMIPETVGKANLERKMMGEADDMYSARYLYGVLVLTFASLHLDGYMSMFSFLSFVINAIKHFQ